MVDVNDLLPSASGSAHLGVNGGPNIDAFDATDIRPFGHIHQNSGIFHDPIMGESGIMRYSKAFNAFQISVNGGRSFGNIAVNNPACYVEKLSVSSLTSSGTFVVTHGLNLTALKVDLYEGPNTLSNAFNKLIIPNIVEPRDVNNVTIGLKRDLGEGSFQGWIVITACPDPE